MCFEGKNDTSYQIIPNYKKLQYYKTFENDFTKGNKLIC